MKVHYTPSVRLLWAVALIGVPAAIVYGLMPDAQLLGGGIIFGLFAVAIVDALLSGHVLDKLEVQTGMTARLGVNRKDKILLPMRWGGEGDLKLRVALALPHELYSKVDFAETILPPGIAWRRVDYSCVPLRRGQWLFEFLYAQTPSSFGLWDVRRRVVLNLDVRIYPNLQRDRAGAAAVFLNQGLTGLHVQRMVGKGREFDKLRDYLPGDSFEDIHWKSTAKRRRPITKTFQVERTQEVYLIIDASRLSTRETGVPTKVDLGELVEGAPEHLVGRVTLLERFVTSALLVALVAEKQGDLFGMVAFADGVSRFVRARNGKGHYTACREALYTLQPRLVSPDLDELSAFLRTRLRHRALLVFLTSLDDPVTAEAFLRNIEPLARQHLVLVNMMNPGNVRGLFDGPAPQTLDGIYEALAAHEGWSQLRETERQLRASGVRFHLLDEEGFTPAIITQYLNMKQRQLI